MCLPTEGSKNIQRLSLCLLQCLVAPKVLVLWLGFSLHVAVLLQPCIFPPSYKYFVHWVGGLHSIQHEFVLTNYIWQDPTSNTVTFWSSRCLQAIIEGKQSSSEAGKNWLLLWKFSYSVYYFIQIHYKFFCIRTPVLFKVLICPSWPVHPLSKPPDIIVTPVRKA